MTTTRICKLAGYHPDATDAVLEVEESGTGRRLARALVVKAHGVCPDCGAEQDLDLLGPWRGQPRPLACRACHRGLELRPA